MGAAQPIQLPLSIPLGSKRESRSQFAALCFRINKNGKIRIMLVTSRRTGRWILPKGWPEDGLTPAQCAAKEAFEEAGVTGKAFERCIGIYSYEKYVTQDDSIPCVAMIYPVKVKKTNKEYKEVDQRRRKWMTRKEAAQRVEEPELKKLIRTFDPKLLK